MRKLDREDLMTGCGVVWTGMVASENNSKKLFDASLRAGATGLDREDLARLFAKLHIPPR